MRPKSYLRFGIFILSLFVLTALSSLLFKGPLKHVANFHFNFVSKGLSEIIESNLEGKSGEFSIYIEDISDEENFSKSSHDPFPAASLYKVYLMAAVLQPDGLKLDDTLRASKSYLTEELGEVDFGYQDSPEEISYSVEEALTRIGRVSDNFAAIMLMDKIGVEKVQNMVNSLGANETSIKSLITTSSSDMGKFFKKLAKKEVVDLETSEKLIDFLSLNQLNSRIPALLPENTKVIHEHSSGRPMVIHKTGELPRIRHDAGYVTLPNGKIYVIVLMSQNLKYEDEGVEVLANISKDVYDYFVEKYSD